MDSLVRFWTDLHAHHPPLYALVTVVSVASAGFVLGGLATGLLARLGAGKGVGDGAGAGAGKGEA